MRYTRADLLQLPDGRLFIDEDMTFEADTYKKFKRITKLRNIHVDGEGEYKPEEQRLYMNLHVTGFITSPCDNSDDQLEFPFDTEADEIFSFAKEDDISIVKSEGDHIELMPTIFQMILMEIPIKVSKPGKVNYPKGEGWEVVSEETYQREKENRADSRLAILKDYKPQDE